MVLSLFLIYIYGCVSSYEINNREMPPSLLMRAEGQKGGGTPKT